MFHQTRDPMVPNQDPDQDTQLASEFALWNQQVNRSLYNHIYLFIFTTATHIMQCKL